MTMNIFKQSLATETSSIAGACGNLILRVCVGLMIFYIHGWHKLHDGLAFLNNGTPWKLAEEVAEMGFPMPVPSAFAATTVQFVCSLMLIFGLFTRLNALFLTGNAQRGDFTESAGSPRSAIGDPLHARRAGDDVPGWRTLLSRRKTRLSQYSAIFWVAHTKTYYVNLRNQNQLPPHRDLSFVHKTH